MHELSSEPQIMYGLVFSILYIGKTTHPLNHKCTCGVIAAAVGWRCRGPSRSLPLAAGCLAAPPRRRGPSHPLWPGHRRQPLAKEGGCLRGVRRLSDRQVEVVYGYMPAMQHGHGSSTHCHLAMTPSPRPPQSGPDFEGPAGSGDSP